MVCILEIDFTNFASFVKLTGMKRLARRMLPLLALLCTTTFMRAELPRLIPREYLFGNPERSSPQLSPDGKQIAWLAPDDKGVLNVWVQPVSGGTPRLLTNDKERPITNYRWAAD